MVVRTTLVLRHHRKVFFLIIAGVTEPVYERHSIQPYLAIEPDSILLLSATTFLGRVSNFEGCLPFPARP